MRLVYNDLIARYNNASEPALHEQIIRASFNKISSLIILGRKKEGKNACDAFLDHLAKFSILNVAPLTASVEKNAKIYNRLRNLIGKYDLGNHFNLYCYA